MSSRNTTVPFLFTMMTNSETQNETTEVYSFKKCIAPCFHAADHTKINVNAFLGPIITHELEDFEELLEV